MTFSSLTKHNPFSHLSSKLLLTVAISSLTLACSNAKNSDSSDTQAKADKASKTENTKALSPSGNVIKLTDKQVAELKKNLAANFKTSGFDTEITKVTPTTVPNLVWVHAKGLPSFFSDTTGKYIIQGDVIEIGQAEPIDVSAPLKQADAKNLLAAVDKKDMVIFKPKGETKSVVYAFTDVDCGYCRKLHSEMSELNAAGVEVRYLAWPRSPQSVPGMVSIWCAEDTTVAMNTAKSGGTVKPATCDNPVEAQMELGHKLGVRGTPAIFTEDGRQIGGYVPAPQLAAEAAKK